MKEINDLMFDLNKELNEAASGTNPGLRRPLPPPVKGAKAYVHGKAVPLKSSGGGAYQKIVDKLKQELMENAKDVKIDDEKEYNRTVGQIQKAKSISDCADIAADLAWDYESFIGQLVKSLAGPRENPKSALFHPGKWST